MKRVFLLGGHDLEMLTIRELLTENGIEFYDRNLVWDTAVLSAYVTELANLQGEDCIIYGVELRQDVIAPNNYFLIDHHNEYSYMISAIEQVADVLDVELSRWQRLVAINDSRYIYGMQNYGATDEEILAIRHADRKAQGVTEEEELYAEEAIKAKMTKEGVDVVYTRSSHFSPVTDRLYPYDRLLIYNDNSLVYYGQGCKKLVQYYHDEIYRGKVFYGGGNNGFLGFAEDAFTIEEIEIHIDNIIKIVTE